MSGLFFSTCHKVSKRSIHMLHTQEYCLNAPEAPGQHCPADNCLTFPRDFASHLSAFRKSSRSSGLSHCRWPLMSSHPLAWFSQALTLRVGHITSALSLSKHNTLLCPLIFVNEKPFAHTNLNT